MKLQKSVDKGTGFLYNEDAEWDGKLLFIFLSTFLPTAAEKFQKNAAQGRTYGSP